MANSNAGTYPLGEDAQWPHRGHYVAFLCPSETSAFRIIKACRYLFAPERQRLIGWISGRAWFILTRVGIWVAFRVPSGSNAKEALLTIAKGVRNSHVEVLAKLEGTRLDTLGCYPLQPYLECDLVVQHCIALGSGCDVDLEKSIKKGEICYAR